MYTDTYKIKFIAIISLFTFFMLILISSGNFIQLFLGWEGVGITSYLLINYWNNRISANKSALKALLFNKIGDFSLLFGIFLIGYKYLSFDFYLISNLNYLLFDEYLYILNYPFSLIHLCCFFIFIGVVGKSSQFGLHFWLPDAMEGPTPVSALIHAATMVTAGIFLMIKCSCFYDYTNFMMYLIIIIGSITSFFSATIGLFQNDIKKIIAYSTCSQLGYMLVSSGFSHYSISLFHLLNHGFFKALLFLGAGVIIHFFINDQDARIMGSFSEYYISLYLILFICTLSLCGFPFFSGFYSKDLILEVSNLMYSVSGNFVKLFQYIAAFFTCLYALRNNNLVFFVSSNSFFNLFVWFDSLFFNTISFFFFNQFFLLYYSIKTFSFYIYNIIYSRVLDFDEYIFIFLYFCSFLCGYVLFTVFVFLGLDIFTDSIDFFNFYFYLFNLEYINISIKLIPLFYIFFSFFLISFFIHLYDRCYFFIIENILIYNFFFFFFFRWYLDILYIKLFVNSFLYFFYNFFFFLIEQLFLDSFYHFGIFSFFNKFSHFLYYTKYTYMYHNIYIYIFTVFLFIFHFIFCTVCIKNILNIFFITILIYTIFLNN